MQGSSTACWTFRKAFSDPRWRIKKTKQQKKNGRLGALGGSLSRSANGIHHIQVGLLHYLRLARWLKLRGHIRSMSPDCIEFLLNPFRNKAKTYFFHGGKNPPPVFFCQPSNKSAAAAAADSPVSFVFASAKQQFFLGATSCYVSHNLK